jgi:hypothetical protein
MAAIVMVAAPVKNFLQEKVDRVFYGERYDCATALRISDARWSATTALDRCVECISQPASGSDERRARCDL